MPKQKYTKRADGRYMTRVYLGKDENGKRLYKSFYGSTQKEVQKKYIEFMSQIEKGIDVLSQNDTFSTWAEKYLNKKKNSVSENYYKFSLKGQLKHFEVLYDLPIAKIKPVQIQEILDELASGKKPLSTKTLTGLKNLAYDVFETAICNRVMDFNPVKAVEVPKGNGKKTRKAITEEQIKWITDTPHKAQTVAMIMLFAGLRRGEALALTWSDINLKEGTITVNKSVEFINNQAHLKNTTKTAAGMRTVYIPEILTDYLKSLEKTSFIVCSDNGLMMSESKFKKMWKSYMSVLNEKYGDFRTDITARRKNGSTKSRFAPGGLPMKIETFTPHQLRHTYASMLYKSGIDVLTAKEQLGHSDVSVTLGIYTHLDQSYKARNMDRLNNFLKNSEKDTTKVAF